MYQFFIEDENAAEDFVTIEGSDVNHIKNVAAEKTGRENPCVHQKRTKLFLQYI